MELELLRLRKTLVVDLVCLCESNSEMSIRIKNCRGDVIHEVGDNVNVYEDIRNNKSLYDLMVRSFRLESDKDGHITMSIVTPSSLEGKDPDGGDYIRDAHMRTLSKLLPRD